MVGDFHTDLERVAEACRATGRTWSKDLDHEARRILVTAFYRAESLAGYALEDAIVQVPEPFVEDLIRQRREEQEHVDVFAGLLVEPPEVARPQTRTRPKTVWFTLLLLNEITGYCQFSLLTQLLETDGQRDQLAQVIREEEEHIARLLRWMQPEWSGRGGPQSRVMVQRFMDGLPGRMEQFFEGEGLAGLRDEVRGHVQSLLEVLLDRVATEAGS